MEPFQHMTATAIRHRAASSLAYSARPDAPVLPVAPGRADRRHRVRDLARSLVPRGHRRPEIVTGAPAC